MIHSGKILILILICLSSFASATVNIGDVPYSGHLSDRYLVTMDWDFNQIAYQKIKTDNETISVSKIQIYIPANATIASGVYEKFIRFGIAKSIPTMTPAQFYAASLANRFKCYASSWSYWGNPGQIVNFTLSTGDTNLEPNAEYYITWYVWADWGATGHAVYWPRGTTPAAFNEWSVHRGNITSAVWTAPYSSYNLSHVLWGTRMSTYTLIWDVTNTTATGSVSINGGDSYGRNWTYGYWLGGTTTDLTVWDVNVTLRENSTTMGSDLNIASLTPGKFYHLRPWICKNDSYAFFHGTEDRFLTNPPPPSNLTVITRDENQTLLNWTNGDPFEDGNRTVIFASPSSYVTDPTNPGADAWEFYRGTANESTNLTGALPLYFTAYTYIDAEEDGENLTAYSLDFATNYSLPPVLNYNIQVFKEKLDYGLVTASSTKTIDYEFATRDHEILYMGTSTNANISAWVNASDILTIRYNWTGVTGGPIYERCIVINQTIYSGDRNISVFVPNVVAGENKSEAKPVTITFRDSTGKFGIKNYGVGIIKKYIQNQTVTVHSDYIQADNAIRTYLITGDQYYFYARSDTLEEIRLGGILVYDDYFSIDVTGENIENNTWRNYISITSGWVGSSGEVKTLWLKVYDQNTGLYSAAVKLYNSSGTFKKSTNYTAITSPKAYDFNFTYATGDINKSGYYANIYMKYHKGKVWWNCSTNYFWNTDMSGIEVDMDTLDSYLTEIIGPSPFYVPATDSTPEVVIPYSTLILTGIIIGFFFLLPGAYAAASVVLVGFILALTRILGIVSSAVLSDLAIAVVFIIGALFYLVFETQIGFGEQVETIKTRVVSWRKKKK